MKYITNTFLDNMRVTSVRVNPQILGHEYYKYQSVQSTDTIRRMVCEFKKWTMVQQDVYNNYLYYRIKLLRKFELNHGYDTQCAAYKRWISQSTQWLVLQHLMHGAPLPIAEYVPPPSQLVRMNALGNTTGMS